MRDFAISVIDLDKPITHLLLEVPARNPKKLAYQLRGRLRRDFDLCAWVVDGRADVAQVAVAVLRERALLTRCELSDWLLATL